MIQKIDLNTRKILHKVHLNRIKNKKGLNRVSNYISTKTLKVKKNFFKGKICGEFGAGSHGGGGLNVLKLGAGYVHLLDVNKNIKRGIDKNLKKFAGKYSIHIGSVDNLPFKNNYFDFVNCSGVLHHIEKPQKAFKEIRRVLKKNGTALVVIHGKGGIMTRITMEILRDEYYKNKLSKKIINELMEGKMSKYYEFFKKNLNTKNFNKVKNILTILSDNDLRMTFKDRILSPKYDLYDQSKLKKNLYNIGFKNFKRTPIKPFFRNVRDLLIPFYYDINHELSKFLYGDGQIRFTVQKK